MGEAIDRLPLFPLGLVLLPEEVVPLHIFEERYKLLIGECLESGEEFGIIWMSDDGLKEVGCTAKVTQVLEQMDDGRMNVLVQGAEPFRLLRRIEDMPYPAGDVELLDEDEESPDPDAGEGARESYADLVERVTDARPSEKDLAQLDAYGMAATLDFALDAKQGLLELRSEQRRLERLRALFGSTLERLEHAERVAEQARTNGHLLPER
ncbi:MAG TPA: LON peptidase substrate-binding domain-containing protein [Thermoleophilaceae bacterium]|nr:LON peptidase substrate-binding domain-containing protein [Thermoleophilaceae bacterium]